MSGLIPFNRGRNSIFSHGDFEDFYNVLGDFFTDGDFVTPRSSSRGFKIDVEDTPDEYRVQAEMPGVSKDEVSVELGENGRLTISTNVEEKIDDSQKNYIHRERRSSSMSRSIYLQDADEGKIDAVLQDGVLSITVGKKGKANKSIPINVR
jgi:HSP20 family protein